MNDDFDDDHFKKVERNIPWEIKHEQKYLRLGIYILLDDLISLCL
jgi:hypothetical protein